MNRYLEAIKGLVSWIRRKLEQRRRHRTAVEINRLQDQIAKLRNLRAYRGAQIEFLTKQLSDRDAENDSLTKQLSDRDAKIEVLTKRLNDRDARIEVLTKRLSDHDTQIDSLNKGRK